MLILILINVYIQKVVASFKKGLNGQNYFSSGSN